MIVPINPSEQKDRTVIKAMARISYETEKERTALLEQSKLWAMAREDCEHRAVYFYKFKK